LLHAAFKAVKRNRGAAGIDKVSIKMFEANLAENLAALERDLKDGSFVPLPLRRKFILKEPGKFRPLGIPAVRDRVGQEVLRRLLDPIFEPLFHNASCGFRKERNCHLALEMILKFHEAGYRVVLDADIKGFFDNLPLAIIMEAVAAQVADGNILRLIEKFLRCGVMEDGVLGRPLALRGVWLAVAYHHSTIWTGGSIGTVTVVCDDFGPLLPTLKLRRL
jgi:group II intron reverse transcriptase/maturase